MNKQYWIESMEAVLDDAGVCVTREQLEKVASGASHVAEMEFEASGQQYIPHPLEAEVRTLKQRLATAEEATEKQREDFVKNICMRHHCEPRQVTLEGDGHAVILK